MEIIFGVCAVVVPFLLLGLALDGCCSTQYIPMTYEEEMQWLMQDHGLSWEEANEYASIPNRMF